MIGYICILLAAFFLGLDSKRINGSKTNRILYLGVVFGGMILFAVLRGYDVAIDYGNRVRSMNLIFEMNFQEFMVYTREEANSQYLYTAFVWLVSRVFPFPWLINSLMDIFVLTTFAWFFYRYSKDVTVSSIMFLTFTFASTLNITRQFVAAAILLIAFHLMIQKKPVKALIVILIAFLVHSSAILMLVMFALYIFDFKLTKSRLLLLLIATAVMFVAFDLIVQLFVQLFPKYEYVFGEWATGDIGFSLIWTTFYVLLFIGVVLTTPSKIKKSLMAKKADTELAASCINVAGYMAYVLISLLKVKMWFISRLLTYFMFGYCMIIPEIMSRFNKIDKHIKALIVLALKVIFVLWGIITTYQDPHGLFPYRFIWEYL